MVDIGNVEIPVVFSIDDDESADVDELDPLPSKGDSIDKVAVKHEPEIKTVTLSGYLNQELHSQNSTIAQQKDDVKSLRTNDTTDNSINYREYKGHLFIENVDLTDDSESRIVNEVVIEARYFPWPKFYPDSEPV